MLHYELNSFHSFGLRGHQYGGSDGPGEISALLLDLGPQSAHTGAAKSLSASTAAWTICLYTN